MKVKIISNCTLEGVRLREIPEGVKQVRGGAYEIESGTILDLGIEVCKKLMRRGVAVPAGHFYGASIALGGEKRTAR